MAKAKKSQQKSEKSATPVTNAPKAETKKPAEKPAPPTQSMVPAIDTNLAAATAAKLVGKKDNLAAAPAASSKESAEFKQLKEGLHKPAGGTPSFLQNNSPTKKFNNSVPGRNQQIGHNQTFGADVNRSGVPRRTGG